MPHDLILDDSNIAVSKFEEEMPPDKEAKVTGNREDYIICNTILLYRRLFQIKEKKRGDKKKQTTISTN